MESLKDRVAIVTGASRGIGLGIAAELVRRGAKVCVTARRPETLAEAVAELGGPDVAIAVPGKADDADHQAEAVARTVEAFGSLDMLVNNTGINPVYETMIDTDPAAAAKILAVNVLAPLAWTRRARDASTIQGEHGGSVVNIASVAGLRASPGIGMYGVGGAALNPADRGARRRARPAHPGQRGGAGRGEDEVRHRPVRGARGGGARRATRCKRLGAARGRRGRGRVPAVRPARAGSPARPWCSTAA